MIERQREDDPLKGLTPREREVLSLMAEGLYSHAVAERFVVSVPAVERNMTRIFAKLGLRQSSEQHRRVLDVLEYLRH